MRRLGPPFLDSPFFVFHSSFFIPPALKYPAPAVNQRTFIVLRRSWSTCLLAVCVMQFGDSMAGISSAADSTGRLTSAQASAFAQLALKGIVKEYPNKLEHVMAHAIDVQSPRALHPAFYGSYDWHSCVHGHWLLMRLLRDYPELAEGPQIRKTISAHITADNIKVEIAYFGRAESRTFERPYGWAWLLKLAETLHGWDDGDAKTWAKNLQPLVDVVVARYLSYFPKQTYPIRMGVHPNSAFGLSFAYDYAKTFGHQELQQLVEERARSYFGKDTAAPVAWEPSGADFFSPTLMEADLMRRVMRSAEFHNWLQKFLPGLAEGKLQAFLTPATVTDRTDPQLVHLDGLNLSRAWAMHGIANGLAKDDPARLVLAKAAELHANAALPHVASGDYAGEHWLASFAVYLLTTPKRE